MAARKRDELIAAGPQIQGGAAREARCEEPPLLQQNFAPELGCVTRANFVGGAMPPMLSLVNGRMLAFEGIKRVPAVHSKQAEAL
jgi:hypothetical protein